MKKLLSALLCLSFLLAAVACKKNPPVEEPEPEPESIYEDYEDVISEYVALLTAKHNGEELKIPDTTDMDARETAIAETLYGIVNRCISAETVEILGYGYKDVDGNGVSELFLLNKYQSVRAILTLSDGKPLLLEESYGYAEGASSDMRFAGKNRFFLIRDSVTDHIEEASYYTFHIEGDRLVYDLAYGAIYDQENKTVLEYFQTVDENRVTIDKETFDKLIWEYERTTTATHTRTNSKVNAPYTHFPLKESISTDSLPVADFSSYDAILSTCQAMDSQVEKFNRSDFSMGNYDNLFSFPNETAFEYYNRLLCTFISNSYRMGYDLIDLNGDGQDELVLLYEDYRIRAIFTQKDGVPVLLNVFDIDFRAYEYWLDEAGFIRVICMNDDLISSNTYELAQTGELCLVSSLLITEIGRYLTLDGKTEEISREKYLELFEEYNCYPEHLGTNEYTRDVSKLTFTPLSESAENFLQSAVSRVWYNYSDLEKTTGKEYGAHSFTYMTFENVTDTQMDVNFKYEFTYYYPDPDKDHYLLNDTTESFLKVTAHKENDVFVFDENGIKGYIEFGQSCQWLIIEQSTDERFPVGAHCFKEEGQPL